MKFGEIDKTKEEENLKSHGVDFTFAQRAWDDDEAVEVPGNTEEPRTVRIAMIDGKLYKVVFAMRDGKARIISAHRAEGGKFERAYYGR
jgi:uncharacterized DUF497 family protein